MSFSDVVRRRYFAEEYPREHEAWRTYQSALFAFKEQCEGPNVQAGVFATGGVYITGNGAFHYVTNGSGVRFNALEAEGLIFRINDVAERAKDWWRCDAKVRWWEPLEDGASRAAKRERKRQQSLAAEREPHLALAYSLTTATYAAMAEENTRHPPPRHESGWLARAGDTVRKRLGRPPREDVARAPSASHVRNLAMLRREVEHAEGLFSAAAQRDAQMLYGKGMLLGMVGLVVVYAIVAMILTDAGVSAETAIGFPAGAVGAVVSVLQRMTFGKLELDYTAGKRMLVWLGAVRPWIGGVLGMALFVFVEAALLPVVPADADLLAFYAAAAFVAGFNERFAQDMLAGSARSLSDPLSRVPAAPDAEGRSLPRP